MAEFHFDLQKIFDDYVASQQKVWAHDRALTVGASEVFSCMRKTFFDKRGKECGYEPDPDYEEDWGAMHRGNLIEDHHVAPAFINHVPKPLKVLFAGQKDQKTLVLDRNSATPDGLIDNIPEGPIVITAEGCEPIRFVMGPEKCMGLEIKSIDPRAVLHEERSKHYGQSQTGLGLIRETTKWKPEYWLIVYVDASFLSRVKPFLVKFDPEVYEAAKRRAPRIWESDNAEAFMAEGKLNNECDYCKWKQACGEASVSRFKQMEAAAKIGDDKMRVIAGSISDRVQKFLELKSQADEIAYEMEATKEELKKALEENKATKIRGDNWSVAWYTQQGRSTLDKKALEATGVDLSKYEKKGAPFDVLKVTVRAGNGDSE